ncbi:uncharacterized protein LOC110882124 [Helianthus annuus]|uniref:uncharacterized protein LOC110882124 n=1 Tax=Helianthus annuus TaxID=4232 RepID=UPI000B8F049E|nr:uncharacterized protein LOC110882124 [Helianthus annuus]
MEAKSDGVNLVNHRSPGNEDNTPPVRGIGLRVTNIEGNPMLPRRGMYSTSNVSVIDGLLEISKPVELDATWGYGGGVTSAKMDAHANPSSSNVLKDVPSFSYADKVKMQTSLKREVNFRKLDATETVQDADVLIPREVIKKVQDKFQNVLYGYFLGNRLPFPVVEYYVKNVWAKYGFSKIMMNKDGFFFFKFDTKEGMAKVLEGGPWLIRKVPLFLNVWSPDVSLRKEGIKSIPVWVKMYNVPIAVYTDDGLSLLASKIGTPKRLDGYTADMCADNWGRSSFARPLIEIDAENELKDHIIVAIPKLEGEGYITEKVKVEYEWQPQRCSLCCIFCHNDQTCAKNVNNKAKQVVVDDEGFTIDKRKVARVGMMKKRQKQKFIYKPKLNKSGASTSGTKEDTLDNNKNANVKTGNAFEALASDDLEENIAVIGLDKELRQNLKIGNGKPTRFENEVEEVVQTEMAAFMKAGQTHVSEGASTPGQAESHVNVTKLGTICNSVFRNWNWTSNGDLCSRGTRIILGWDSDVVDLMVLAQTDQVIHTQMLDKAYKKVLFCSFVYAENKYQDRRSLWESLCNHKSLCHDKPWVVMGDFNATLQLEDSLYGTSQQMISMGEFKDCFQFLELLDIQGHGLQFTWNQRPKDGVGLLKKIDRVMGNIQFLDLWPNAFVMYHPFRVSDHTPCILKMGAVNEKKIQPFKFPNFIASKPEFLKCVDQEWRRTIPGFNMFSVTKKLSNLKPHLRKILFNQGNLHAKVSELRKKLDEIQVLVDNIPLDGNLRQLEAACLQDFQSAAYDEECFLKQKSKVEWFCAGDSNTKYFHNVVKSRNARSKIHSVKDTSGIRHEGSGVAAALVTHYSNFLGVEDQVTSINLDSMFVNVLTHEAAANMVRQVTREEVKAAMFNIGENKAPGPDGYTSAFFKKAWDIIDTEVTDAVLDFFDNGKLLKQLNHTILALIPKKDIPDSVLDYRPISCCNVLYKCISKIITDRIKGSLGALVSINQSAFVPGRKTSDNILLTQELMHNYHLNRGPARCAFKIDIQKAYDTVSWSFLKAILIRFGFDQRMVQRIMMCVSTASYSLSVNGNLHGFFKGKRGLRQGDPMSPYLFTLIMEVLSLLLQQAADVNSSFKFHHQCAKQRIINVSFADDLFIFVHADICSVKKVRDALEIFTSWSGLVPSPTKSTAYFSNVPSLVKQQILSLMPFQEGNLPVRYLGVPLISTKLIFKDCKILIDRMESRITSWISKSVSFAGRLQLINSVLSSMHIYWASVFILPARVISELEKRMRRFLWNVGSSGRIRAKVAWSDVCLPKNEGGLGIRNVGDVNKALMTNHIWSIITNQESLWVWWIHSYKLKGRSFWEVPCRGSVSWGWRKILYIRNLVRPYMGMSIKSGVQTNAWCDNWCPLSPISTFITPRTITNAGFNMHTTVADIVDASGQWRWPAAWYHLFPVLINLQPPSLVHNVPDKPTWKDLDGKDSYFSSKEVWNNIRSRGDTVSWFNMIWFSQCIPRHSFHMWLVIRNKLKTQDRLMIWEAGSATNLRLMCCPLCRYDRDHLFFQCNFASQVWNNVKTMVTLENVSDSWASICAWMERTASSKTTNVIVGKILIAAMTYFIWQERNARLFSHNHKSAEVVTELVKHIVRLKLMGFKFRGSADRNRVLKAWKIYSNEDELDPG